jgi:hypothetical protein
LVYRKEKRYFEILIVLQAFHAEKYEQERIGCAARSSQLSQLRSQLLSSENL